MSGCSISRWVRRPHTVLRCDTALKVGAEQSRFTHAVTLTHSSQGRRRLFAAIVRSFVRSLVYSFVRSLVYSFVRSLVGWFVGLFHFIPFHFFFIDCHQSLVGCWLTGWLAGSFLFRFVSFRTRVAVAPLLVPQLSVRTTQRGLAFMTWTRWPYETSNARFTFGRPNAGVTDVASQQFCLSSLAGEVAKLYSI